MIYLCQSILKIRRISCLHGSAPFTIPLRSYQDSYKIRIRSCKILAKNFHHGIDSSIYYCKILFWLYLVLYTGCIQYLEHSRRAQNLTWYQADHAPLLLISTKSNLVYTQPILMVLLFKSVQLTQLITTKFIKFDVAQVTN